MLWKRGCKTKSCLILGVFCPPLLLVSVNVRPYITRDKVDHHRKLINPPNILLKNPPAGWNIREDLAENPPERAGSWNAPTPLLSAAREFRPENLHFSPHIPWGKNWLSEKGKMDICFDLWSRQKPPEVQTKIFYNSFSQKVCIVFILSPDVHINPSNPGLNFIVIYPTSLTKGTKVEIFCLVLPYTNDSLYWVKFGGDFKNLCAPPFSWHFFGSENS